MMNIFKDYFDQHSSNYAARVLDRRSWPHLDLEDRLITSLLQAKIVGNQAFSIIDAGCGTGDRLRNLLEQASVPLSLLQAVIGLDYSRGMLERAAAQRYANQKLYHSLFEADLLAEVPSLPPAELVLCLWGIVNTGALYDLEKVLGALSRFLASSGQLVFDIRTIKGFSGLKDREQALYVAHPELPPLPNPNAAWHRRSDGTFGAMRYLTTAELGDALAANSLILSQVWGYDYRSPEATALPLAFYDSKERYEEQFSFLLCVAQRMESR